VLLRDQMCGKTAAKAFGLLFEKWIRMGPRNHGLSREPGSPQAKGRGNFFLGGYLSVRCEVNIERSRIRISRFFQISKNVICYVFFETTCQKVVSKSLVLNHLK